MTDSAFWGCSHGKHSGCGDCARKVVAIAMVANVCGVVVKFIVGLLAGSRALIADALHSLTDTLSYGINFTGSRLLDRDGDAPSVVPGLLVGSVTFLSGVGITAHNAAILFRGTQHRPGLLGLVVSAASIAVNARLVYMAWCATRKSDDHAAYVCLVQVRTDLLSSSLAFVSMLAAWAGFALADPLCALVIGCLLVGSSITILRSTAAQIEEAPVLPGRLVLILGALALALVSVVVRDSLHRNHVILVPSLGTTGDSPVDSTLGFAPYFVVVDTRASTATPIANTSRGFPGDASAQLVELTDLMDVDVVLSARVGAATFDELQAAGIRMYYLGQPMTVTQAVQGFLAGSLEPTAVPDVQPGLGPRGRPSWLRPW